MNALRISTFLIAAYLFAWALAFISVAGSSFSLMPSYFIWGWSLSGGELPSFVWLFSWPIYFVILLAGASVTWVRRRRQP